MKNFAFVDWQNLYLWTTFEWWKVDFSKLRRYLKDKFKVSNAYFFMWFKEMTRNWLYVRIQEAWFILIFKDFNEFLASKKKWNVDCDLVFHVMKSLYKKEDFDKVVLLSGDWDFYKLVDFLIIEWRFEKILFPNKQYSSLYNNINISYRMYLWDWRTKEKNRIHK
jgi:hypothetical protein